MIQFIQRTRIILLFSLFAVFIVGCSSSAQLSSTHTELPSATETNIPPTNTPLPILPTETHTQVPPTQTPTETESPTPTLTPSETATPTEVPLVAVIYASSVCRHGPGTAYTIHTYFSENSTAFVQGQTEAGSWLLVEPADLEETCWIFKDIVDLEKEISMVPVLTPPPFPTPAPVPTKTEEELALGPKYFLIIPANGGPFACGDGLAYFYSYQKSHSREEDITIALNALFSVRAEYVGNYYNPVYQSSLRVKDVDFDNGRPTIRLGGTFVKPKNKCEAERMHLVVWETASQFSSVTSRPIIYVGNVLLGDMLQAVQDK